MTFLSCIGRSAPVPTRLLTTWLGSALLALMLCALAFPLPSSAATSQPRLSEGVAPGSSLAKLAGQDAGLAADLAALKAEAAKAGGISVAVKTDVAFAPESLLGAWEATQQRREIAAAAQELRKALPKLRIVQALEDMPYVIIETDVTGLSRLAEVPGLVRISDAGSFNWRRDFVELRQKSMRPGAHGSSAPAMAQPRMMAPRIVGGQNADPTAHPFQVGLLAKRIRDNFRAQFCGGTLVAERYVVTAAHCSDDIRNPSRQVQVLVGTQRLDGSGQRINVKSIFIHPGWNAAAGFDNDVAVWELATPVSGIAFASLASIAPTVAATPLRVTGWGTLAYQSNSYPNILQQVDVPFVPASGGSCGSQTGITSRMICAGESGKDSCQGDSGGPLTINRGGGFTELVGIVSFGNGCGTPGFPGVYANVAESGINSFIRNIVFPPPKTLGFAVATQSVSEGERQVTVSITRSTPVGAANVRFTTVPGTAASRRDFRARSGIVRFPPGSTTASVVITILDDGAAEQDESFTLRLSRPSSGWTFVAGTDTTTVTIADNDQPMN
ncbi:MAG: trypsin-like serine protease [Aestuariivirga sp.]|nr:trypsin-like serine protease [Aestuariivirga sp.]